MAGITGGWSVTIKKGRAVFFFFFYSSVKKLSLPPVCSALGRCRLKILEQSAIDLSRVFSLM